MSALTFKKKKLKQSLLNEVNSNNRCSFMQILSYSIFLKIRGSSTWIVLNKKIYYLKGYLNNRLNISSNKVLFLLQKTFLLSSEMYFLLLDGCQKLAAIFIAHTSLLSITFFQFLYHKVRKKNGLSNEIYLKL